MKRLAILLFAALLLSGCISSQSVEDRIIDQWVGQNFYTFVLTHGRPRASYRMTNGMTIHTWSSRHTVRQPRVSETRTDPLTGVRTRTTTGGNFTIQCTIDILVHQNTNTITDIRITSDLSGSILSSRCGEIFPAQRQPRPDSHITHDEPQAQ